MGETPMAKVKAYVPRQGILMTQPRGLALIARDGARLEAGGGQTHLRVFLGAARGGGAPSA